jgi:copper ion binding protein
MEKQLFIDGMTCNHCKARVEKALLALDGVQQAEVFLDQKKAVIQLTAEIDNAILVEAVDDAGYDVVEIK